MPLDNPLAGPTISTGAYTGNGATSRQISTGYKCKFVIIFSDHATYEICSYLPECWVITGGFSTDYGALHSLRVQTSGILVPEVCATPRQILLGGLI